LAHQYINQLVFDGNATVKDAIFGNVGTLVSFRVGAEDAEHLEKEFDPIFLMNDIVNLSKYDIYLKLMIDGIAGDAFSARTLPPADISDTLSGEEKVIAVSRERYGKSRTEVAEKIARWSGMDVGIGFDEFAPAGDQKENNYIKNEKPPKLENNNSSSNQGVVEKNRPTADHSERNQAQVGATKNSEQKKETIAAENAKQPLELFEAFCSTCEEKITVPFRPDPNRKTFCKECLRDYQRARAKAQMQNNPPSSSDVKNNIHTQPTIRAEIQSSASMGLLADDGKISLNQIAHMAPKKFKGSKKELNLNKEEIRNLLSTSKNNQNFS
jgi:CxxC-x17-CxxC domain-containing protein